MKILFQKINYQNYTNNIQHKTLSKKDNVNLCTCNCDNTSFTSIKNFPPRLYFVRMSTYKSNYQWNEKMRKATQIISSMMQKNADVKKILHMTEYCINIINKSGKTKSMFGIKKTVPTGFIDLLSKPETRGYEYTQIYQKYFKNHSNGEFYVPKANEAYNNAITCKILIRKSSVAIQTGKNNPANIETNLTLVEKAYKLLKEKKSPTKKEIVDTAATIQWLIAQETPYKRGSDSVANLLTRSLLDSYGIELSPIKAGVSCDFEAFCRDLDDYIKIYPTLFEKNLMI